MPAEPDVVDQALERLALQLARYLEPDGWRLRRYEVWPFAVFTRDVGGEFLATVGLGYFPGDPMRRDEWPIELYLVFGCGYEPATGLMPLLTLAPKAALIIDAQAAGGERRDVTLAGPDAVDRTATDITEAIVRHGLEFAKQHASVDALEIGLTDRERESEDVEVRLRPVLLAAAGRHDRARQLVNDYVHDGASGTDDREYRRFVRQLHRWLDAGSPPIPPVEETLSRLPPSPARPARPSMAKARRGVRDRQAAWDRVRAEARGKTVQELTTMLAAAYAEHGVETAPSMLAVGVEQLQLDLRPFGRARRHMQIFGVLGPLVGMVKGYAADPEPDPEWLQPPERASYPVPSNGRRWAGVVLDAEAQDWLARIVVEAPLRVRGSAVVDAWLTEEKRGHDDGTLIVVHIGERTVGTLRADDAGEFAPYLAAAQMFDESVRVVSRVFHAVGDAGVALEIQKPDNRT